MNLIVGFALSMCAWGVAFAYEPSDVSEGAQKYDQTLCQESYAENCINMVCVDGVAGQAESPHCTQNCTDEAADKCASMGQ